MDDGGALQLRMMELDDIPMVSPLERGAYTEHWPSTNFERELTDNPVARYIVLSRSGQVVGFAGLWIQVDEGHVVNVVVPNEERGKGYGKLLLHALLGIAIDLKLTLATLEVRSTNAVARALYRDYGFWEVGERKRYYSDGEDALIMTTDDLDSPAFLGRYERNLTKLLERFPGTGLQVPSGDAS